MEEIGTFIETAEKEMQAKEDMKLSEDAIYDMTKSEGWRLMMKQYRAIKYGLLQPIPTKEISTETNLETVGAMALARAGKIEALDEFVNFAESVRIARDIEMKNRTANVEIRQGE